MKKETKVDKKQLIQSIHKPNKNFLDYKNIVDYLEEFEYFNKFDFNLKSSHVIEFLNYTQIILLNKSDIIYKQYQKSEYLYLVIAGKVDFLKQMSTPQVCYNISIFSKHLNNTYFFVNDQFFHKKIFSKTKTEVFGKCQAQSRSNLKSTAIVAEPTLLIMITMENYNKLLLKQIVIELETKTSYLQTIFKDFISYEKIKKFAPQFQIKKFQQNEIIVEQGTTFEFVYIILQGQMDVSYIEQLIKRKKIDHCKKHVFWKLSTKRKQKQEKTLSKIQENFQIRKKKLLQIGSQWFVGLMEYFDKSKVNLLQVTTLTQCKVLQIEIQAFQNIFAQYKELQQFQKHFLLPRKIKLKDIIKQKIFVNQKMKDLQNLNKNKQKILQSSHQQNYIQKIHGVLVRNRKKLNFSADCKQRLYDKENQKRYQQIDCDYNILCSRQKKFKQDFWLNSQEDFSQKNKKKKRQNYIVKKPAINFLSARKNKLLKSIQKKNKNQDKNQFLLLTKLSLATN